MAIITVAIVSVDITLWSHSFCYVVCDCDRSAYRSSQYTVFCLQEFRFEFTLQARYSVHNIVNLFICRVSGSAFRLRDMYEYRVCDLTMVRRDRTRRVLPMWMFLDVFADIGRGCYGECIRICTAQRYLAVALARHYSCHCALGGFACEDVHTWGLWFSTRCAIWQRVRVGRHAVRMNSARTWTCTSATYMVLFNETLTWFGLAHVHTTVRCFAFFLI